MVSATETTLVDPLPASGVQALYALPVPPHLGALPVWFWGWAVTETTRRFTGWVALGDSFRPASPAPLGEFIAFIRPGLDPAEQTDEYRRRAVQRGQKLALVKGFSDFIGRAPSAAPDTEPDTLFVVPDNAASPLVSPSRRSRRRRRRQGGDVPAPDPTVTTPRLRGVAVATDSAEDAAAEGEPT